MRKKEKTKNLGVSASLREPKKTDAKPVLIPTLRFPEFREAPGWDATILGELSEVVRGGSPRPIDGFITTSADGLNWLKIGDVDKEAKYVTKTADKVRREALSKTRVVSPGDLILSNSMSFGRPYILQIKTCIHDGWIAITSIAEETERDFLYYQISAPSSQNYFMDNAAGSGVLNLNAEIIKALPICFPQTPEQQKIADCLSSLDELIAAQARKVNALKTHKKGLMQQLFPREGETQPRLRFPEFIKAGEWEDANLGERISIKGRIGYRGYTVEDIVDAGQGAISVSPSNITDSGTLRFEKATYISWPKYHESPEIMVEVGQTLLVKTGSTYGKVSFVRDLPQECTVNPQVVVLKPKSINPYFLFLLVFGESIQTKIQATVVGGAIPTLSQESISKFEIRVPSLPEQQRIADCLTTIDDLIAAQTQKIEALKTHKKGLMQQLFPSPEEVAFCKKLRS